MIVLARLTRLAGWVFAGVVALVIVAVVGGRLWLRSPWGHDFVRHQIVERLGDMMWGDVRLDSVGGDPLTGIVLRGFALVGEDEEPLIEVDEIHTGYSLLPFLDKRIELAELRLVRPRIQLVRDTLGRWNFRTLFKPREPRPRDELPGWGSVVAIRRLEFDEGMVVVRLARGDWPVFDWSENRFEDLHGALGFRIESRRGDVRRFEFDGLGFRTTAPALDVRRVFGRMEFGAEDWEFGSIELETDGSLIRADGIVAKGPRDTLALEIDADRIDLAEAGRFFSHMRLEGSASYRGRLTGPAGNPTVTIDEARVDTGTSILDVRGGLYDLASLRLDLAVEAESLSPEDIRRYLSVYPLAQPISGSIRVTGPPRRFRLDTDLRAPAGRFTVDGDLDFTGRLFAYDVEMTTSALSIGALLGNGVDLELSGVYGLNGEGVGEGDLNATFVARLDRAHILRWDFVALETRGRLLGRAFLADTIVARSPLSVVRGRGVFGLRRDGVLASTVSVDTESVSEVWRGLDWLDGRYETTASLEGTYEDFDVDADVVGTDVEVSTVGADSFTGHVVVEHVGEGLELEAEGDFARLRAPPITVETAGVSVAYGRGRMTFGTGLDHAGGGHTRLEGQVDFTGEETVTWIDRLEYRSPRGDWFMEEGGRLALAEGRLRAEEIRLVRGDQTVRLNGELVLAEESDLAVTAENVDLGQLAHALGQPSGDWQGRASVEGRLRGTRTDPLIQLSGDVSEGSIYGLRYLRIHGEVDYADKVAQVGLTVTTPTEGHDIVVEGGMPIDLALASGVERLADRPVDLRVRGVNTDLTLLGAVVPGLSDLAGPIDLRVDIRGTSAAPELEGHAVLTDGRMRIDDTGVTYQDIQGSVAFTNDRIEVEELIGTDGSGGSFEISGSIDAENLKLGEFDLSLEARNLNVLDRDRQEVWTSGTIDIGGTSRTPVLTGVVKVEQLVYRLPESSKKQVIDLDEAVIYVDIPGATGEIIERSPSLWDRSRLELIIDIGEDAFIRSRNARIGIGGELSLFKPAGIRIPAFSGTLNVKEGYYEEFGQRFTIEEGEAFFYGTPEINPALHVVATRTVRNVPDFGDVEIQITLGGTLRSPRIDLASVPVFDKSEIVSIALFGTPNPSLGQQGQFNQALTGLVTGAAAMPLRQALSEELGIDTVEFSQREDQGQTSSLFRVGTFFSPNVYVTYEQEFGGVEEYNLIGVRYRISDRFTVQASAGSRQLDRLVAGLDLFWEFTY